MTNSVANCLRQITEAACALYCVRQADVWDGVRRPTVSLARRQICAALYATGRFSLAEVAEMMGFDTSSIATMLRLHRTALQTDPAYADAHQRLLRVVQ